MSNVRIQTTAIGSLPHHNVDAALQVAFQTSIPFLPQIPIRNPWEFMLAQALEGMPGLQVEEDGSVTLNLGIWESRSAALNQKLNAAFQNTSDPDAFQAFEPSTASSSSWQAFVWELEERKVARAKIQIAGPLTTQWSLRTREGTSVDTNADVAMQIYRLVMARSIAMVRRLKASRVSPIIYLDEPGLYGLSNLMGSSVKFTIGLQELKLLIQSLKKEGATVGLHCCSDTDWDAVLNLGVDIISLDTGLSLRHLLTEKRLPEIRKYVEAGGTFSFGVIPTARSSVLRSMKPSMVFTELLSAFEECGAEASFVRKILNDALYTPACGLALHSVSDADLALDLLQDFSDYCAQSLSKGSS